MRCIGDKHNEQLLKYTPCSHLLVTKSTLPRLLVHVNSTEGGDPWFRPELTEMLLAGAAVVRFANGFLESFQAKDFVLVAIMFWDYDRATRYTLFQQENHKAVCCFVHK